VIASAPYARAGLVAVDRAKGLDAAWAELPAGTLWLVGHRALRNVPRMSAVWDFLIEGFGDQALKRGA
jgi:hypothetical protein